MLYTNTEILNIKLSHLLIKEKKRVEDGIKLPVPSFLARF